MTLAGRGFRAFALCLACAPAARGPAPAHVEGTATYREHLALPPGAVLEATLEDVSKPDTWGAVVGSARVARPGTPPIRFAIPYDPSLIDAKHQYAVRARILVRGRLVFVTDGSYPVLTGGRGNEVDLVLRRAGGPALIRSRMAESDAAEPSGTRRASAGASG